MRVFGSILDTRPPKGVPIALGTVAIAWGTVRTEKLEKITRSGAKEPRARDDALALST